MPQTPERRMYLMYRAVKKRGGEGGSWYRRGEGCSPLMSVARAFRIPVRELREIIEAQMTAQGLTCRYCGQPGARKTLHPFDLEIYGIRREITACGACCEKIADDI